jgi:hypothetical protein
MGISGGRFQIIPRELDTSRQPELPERDDMLSV